MVKGETKEFNLSDSFHTCNHPSDISFLCYNCAVFNVNLSSFTEQGGERKAKKINKKRIGEDLNQHLDELKSMAT